jgi:1-deoxy-D-xylulose-5-phosphate synthase
MVTPHTFFENLGVRYVGPIDGHNIEAIESALSKAAEWDGPIVVHLLTEKGRGFKAAVDDNMKLHDYKVPPKLDDEYVPTMSFTESFSRSLVEVAEADERIVALTAAMAGPTGLLPFQQRFPDRFFDVGIAEQHEVTAAAGMAMGGLKPVVCVYSTFFSRAFDQANLDVGLHGLPVVMVLDRAGITGDDGPSHHGILDMSLSLSIPGMTVFAPSSAEEVPVMLRSALSLTSPTVLRFPKTLPQPLDGAVGTGLFARRIREGDGSLCVIGIGKMTASAFAALGLVGDGARSITLWDARVIPTSEDLVRDALRHDRIITIEDGVRLGGAGEFIIDQIQQAADRSNVTLPPVQVLGVPREYLQHHSPDALLAELGLDPTGIADTLIRTLHNESAAERTIPSAPRPHYLP